MSSFSSIVSQDTTDSCPNQGVCDMITDITENDDSIGLLNGNQKMPCNLNMSGNQTCPDSDIDVNMEIDFLLQQLDVTRKEVEKLEEENSSLKKEIQMLVGENVDIKNEIKFLISQHLESAEVPRTNFPVEQKKFMVEFQTMRDQHIQLQRELNSIMKKCDYFSKEEDTIRSALTERDKNIQRQINREKELLSRIQLLEDERQDLVNENKKILGEINVVMQNVGQKEKQEELDKLMNEFRKKISECERFKQHYEVSQKDKLHQINIVEEKCENVENEKKKIKYLLQSKEAEILTLKAEVEASQNLSLAYKTDKETLYEDVQELCSKLAERDEGIINIQEKNSETMYTLQKQMDSQRGLLKAENGHLEAELDKAKHTVIELNGHIKSQDQKLSWAETVKRELQEEKIITEKFEKLCAQLQEDLLQSKKTTAKLNILKITNSEKMNYLQDSLQKSQTAVMILKDQLKKQWEKLHDEHQETKSSKEEERLNYDIERTDLLDRLSQLQSHAQTTSAQLKTVTEQKALLQNAINDQEKATESFRLELQEAVAAKKLADQSTQNLQQRLEETKEILLEKECKLEFMNDQLSSLKDDLYLEREKIASIQRQCDDLQVRKSVSDARVVELEQRTTDLENENICLRNKYAEFKQTKKGKIEQLTLQLKEARELLGNEKQLGQSQVKQLSLSLEDARDEISVKNRTNGDLQQRIITLEDTCSDLKIKLHSNQENLNYEIKQRIRMRAENQEKEREITKWKTKAKTDGSMEALRIEMSKMVANLGVKMQQTSSPIANSRRSASPEYNKEFNQNTLKAELAKMEHLLLSEEASNRIMTSKLAAAEESYKLLQQQMEVLKREPNMYSQIPVNRESKDVNEEGLRQTSVSPTLSEDGSHVTILSINKLLASKRQGSRSTSNQTLLDRENSIS